MSDLSKRGEGWTLWASQQMEIERERRNKIVMGGVALFIGVVASLYIGHQNKRIDYLTANRQMYCENSGVGLYRSTAKRPQEMVTRYAREYLNNLKQFDQRSAKINFERALSMMSPDVAAATRPTLEAQIETVRKQSLSQWITVTTEDVTEDASTYTYTATAKVGGHTGTTPLPTGVAKVTVVLRKIAPSDSRPEGLMVVESRG
ncbi:hypothetical protein E4T66_18305 [Sinimarinibacterium sp. CAU 1509]|uniref:hypothetical protein n=1 Tax=Sinimarinibacterium sp. CAU 1509 TaxID=2562283 RepID=UPI0010AD8ECA|nr:hypothetical protein [Sinimarinibacterium sp. CAU 1509]TJY57359.1 hypothetical protein E4T66_18305 [Sinimarinibacterium sp. CAU 1509]